MADTGGNFKPKFNLWLRDINKDAILNFWQYAVILNLTLLFWLLDVNKGAILILKQYGAHAQ
jgi:hypothetical protein